MAGASFEEHMDIDPTTGEAPIGTGTTVVVVRDELLAAAMIAVGIRLRKDPPYTHVRLNDGREQWSFSFHLADDEGRITAKECIEAWQKDLKWIKANPMHPFAFAMTAVKNYAHIREHQRNSTPYHVYAMPSEDGGEPPKLFVKAGSKKEKLAIAQNYQQL